MKTEHNEEMWPSAKTVCIRRFQFNISVVCLGLEELYNQILHQNFLFGVFFPVDRHFKERMIYLRRLSKIEYETPLSENKFIIKKFSQNSY